MQEVTKNKSPISAPSSTKKYGIIAAAVIAPVLLFASGWAFGSGRITASAIKTGTTKNSPTKVDYSSVNEVVSALTSNYDGIIDEAKILDGIKGGVAKASGDPYTEYFNTEDAKAFQDELSGSFEGIGAELGKEGNNIVIISPLAGSPAEKAGIKARDIIYKIDGNPSTDITISEAVKRIRGKADTEVKLTIVRNGTQLEITIKRAQISVPSVKSEIVNGIGILTVTRFAEDTPALAIKAAQEFKVAGVKGVVLDMRNDPGGLLDSAVKLSSLWLDNGKTILLEKRGGKVEKTFTATGTPTLKGIKTVVLINEGSASASEITAGALHDNGVATLMGVKSYGKGSVQQILQLDGGGTLKVTIARWYTPNDKNIDKEGITPEKEVKITDEDIAAKRDPQKDAALDFLK